MDEVADSDDAGCHSPRTQSWVLGYLSKVKKKWTNTIEHTHSHTLVLVNYCRHYLLGCTPAVVENLKLTGGLPGIVSGITSQCACGLDARKPVKLIAIQRPD